MSAGDRLPDPLGDLIEAYCDGVISEPGMQRLEAYLLQDEQARRAFVAAFHLHTELHFAMRARRATVAALERVAAIAPAGSPGGAKSWSGGRAVFSKPLLVGAILAASLLLTVLVAAWISAGRRPPNEVASSAKQPSDRDAGNIAWLVNAQDCRWAEAESEMPGRDMRAGKRLRLQGGLAQIEFDQGARVLLQGPAELVLISGSEARLVHGTSDGTCAHLGSGFHYSVSSGQGRRPGYRVWTFGRRSGRDHCQGI